MSVHPNRSTRPLALWLGVPFLLAGCAAGPAPATAQEPPVAEEAPEAPAAEPTLEAAEAAEAAKAPEAAEAPAAGAAGIPVAVLPLGLTETTSRRYPQLAERNVGLGVHNLLVDRLYDTGRFRFVEEKPEVVADLLDRQWVASTGAVSAESAVQHGRLLGARYVLYGEVYDFGLERLGTAGAETRISIQIRLVDVETSEYVPASGTGELRREGDVLSTESELAFTRSTVGLATDRALAAAVETLMRRFRPAAPDGGSPEGPR